MSRNALHLLLCCLLPSMLWAQSPDHVSGQLIVQLMPGHSIDQLQADFQQDPNDPVTLRHLKSLSPRLNLHLISFDPQHHEGALLKRVHFHRRVIHAQYNHFVESRKHPLLSPNDPDFPQQWALENTGQSGGSFDADIDATEAWDITTGGLSALGDSIVIAVIDDGFSLDHEDLNFWKNYGEIPGNNIDDDGNGYIDDFNGWNAYNSTGAMTLATHGTHVTGIAAAKGDNNTGISGVTWDVKVMPVAGSSGTEAVVMEAYTYVLEARARYNETQGQSGTFVVATNSSFGVNFGDPQNFPIWCALYDSLGAQGILNVASTMNIGSDVDVVGDIPTSCGSDWLITVTNTTDNDSRNSGAAFGANTVDLGAPGTNVYSTLPSQSYGFDTGTSMSAPQVTGVLALMFSAACPAFMVQYRNDPGQAALAIKDYLLQGVDTLPGLTGFTVTGGRLNAFQAINVLLDSCESLNIGCLPAYGLAATSNSDTTARLTWALVDSSVLGQIRYRPVGATAWILSDTLSIPELNLSGLNGCQDYEFQVQTICDSSTSGFFSTSTFQTLGCCESPAGITVIQRTDTAATLGWIGVFGATGYELLLQAPNGTSQSFLSPDTTFAFTDLIACSRYQLRIATICEGEQTDTSEVFLFDTEGCGACRDSMYCPSRGTDVTFEWIQRVQVGPIDQVSGANGGYGDFTAFTSQLVIDSTYDVELTPGYASMAFTESWRIWIDFNQDGVFDSSELALDPIPQIGPLISQITIPPDAFEGNTRMRVSMKFPGFSGNEFPTPCLLFTEGEVEDYCITLTFADTPLCVVPVPETVILETTPGNIRNATLSWEHADDAGEFQIQYRPIGGNWTTETLTDTFRVLTGLEDCQQYEWRVASLCSGVFSGYTSTQMFTTQGCGTCLDSVYCETRGINPDSIRIQSFQLADVTNTSSGEGYGDFTQIFLGLHRGADYLLELTMNRFGENFPYTTTGWVDWNQNGVFDPASETLFNRVGITQDTIQATISIPDSGLYGNARLRVSVSTDNSIDPCGAFDIGEVEDYCLEFLAPISVEDPFTELFKVYPNPSTGIVFIEHPQSVHGFRLLDLAGRELDRWDADLQGQTKRDLTQFSNGLYLLEFISPKDRMTLKLQLNR
ncbi:GEVED domain-containing protein [Pontibacter sp. G13]|uniref:GEVED domain-containing protein n=1 Tax=Pontibacter sp. G13 TaxID=3074898 RepID=UPI00288A1DBF|nr:GEVED domain-containing protein [Pontibacter sp. G13]WNJ20317.1 GEVED domain-containing protein [Pontibacter sp. G13]